MTSTCEAECTILERPGQIIGKSGWAFLLRGDVKRIEFQASQDAAIPPRATAFKKVLRIVQDKRYAYIPGSQFAG